MLTAQEERLELYYSNEIPILAVKSQWISTHHTASLQLIPTIIDASYSVHQFYIYS